MLTKPLLSESQKQSKADQQDQSNDLMSLTYPHDILIVEDNIVNQMVATAILKKLGYQCDVAGNGQEALDMLKLRQYSLIFMDIQMPVMDGLTASKAIIREYGENSPKIVAMTANVYSKDKIKCKEAGMVDFIGKPILVDHIHRVLKLFCSDK